MLSNPKCHKGYRVIQLRARRVFVVSHIRIASDQVNWRVYSFLGIGIDTRVMESRYGNKIRSLTPLDVHTDSHRILSGPRLVL
jgi:hypothetical protein